MTEPSGSQGPLRDDPALVPPPAIEGALRHAEAEAKKGRRWVDGQTTGGFLKGWARVIDDIGSYREHGSDDYHHHLSYRITLHRVLVLLRELGHDEALAWLQGEVDRLDQVFLERSTYDAEGLILREEKTNPAYWFMRRLPNDQNVVDHLRMIQPKRRQG